MDQKEDEQAPLLQAEATSNDPEPSTSSVDPIQEQSTNNGSNNQDFKFIQCHVCKASIDISNKKETFVVKCNLCNEATPIRKAPPKKRYIRCSCQCLLICFENAQRIVCPRSNCKKIITVKDVAGPGASKSTATATPSGSNFQSQQRSVAAQNNYLSIGQYRTQPQPANRDSANVGQCFVLCGHCGHRFTFNTLRNTLARCNVCRRLSSVGREFSRTRGIIFMVLSLMFVAVGVGVQFGATPYSDSYLVIGLYAILYAISVIFFCRSLYYLSMKISQIEGQGNSAM